MSKFKNIAKLIRDKRVNGVKQFTQSEISKFLGDKSGHLISDIERGLCDIPVDVISEISNILGISKDEMEEARNKDKEDSDK
jgi:predicted house-cleaning noncanonical NTP pyrophosphatase (MazG superfamily)